MTEVQDEDVVSLIHKDLQVQLKISKKELEIQSVRKEKLSMKLQIIEARLKRLKSDAQVLLLLRDISVLAQKMLLAQININQIKPLPNDLPPKYEDLEQPPKYEEPAQEQQQAGQQQRQPLQQ